jgi:hypothetical protein
MERLSPLNAEQHRKVPLLNFTEEEEQEDDIENNFN